MGAVYGSLALALVMIHRSTGLVNFAQGEMAMLSTYLAWSLVQAGAPYWVAFAATIGISFLCGFAVHWGLMKPLTRAPHIATTIVFVGMILIINSLAGWLFTYSVQSFPSPFSNFVSIPGYFSSHELGAIAVMLLVLLTLLLFFRLTTFGLKMRGAAENPLSSRLLGIRVDLMLATGWGIAAAVGAVGGMMVAPILYLDPNMMSGVLLYGFAAALIGGINNPAGAVAGGLIVGVMENAVAFLVGSEVKLTAALLVIVATMILRPAGIFSRVVTRRV